MIERRGSTTEAVTSTRRRGGGGCDNTVAMIESAAWLQLDLADYLRMPRPMSVVDKQGRDALRKRIRRQLKQQEHAGDPLRIVTTVRRFMEGTEIAAGKKVVKAG